MFPLCCTSSQSVGILYKRAFPTKIYKLKQSIKKASRLIWNVPKLFRTFTKINIPYSKPSFKYRTSNKTTSMQPVRSYKGTAGASGPRDTSLINRPQLTRAVIVLLTLLAVVKEIFVRLIVIALFWLDLICLWC